MEAQTLKASLRVYAALSDGEVVERVRAGDLPLFELIMRRYNRRLFRYARSILNDDQLAQDAMQEAYLAAFRHLAQFRGPDGFGAWLMRIAARAAIRIGRREARMRLVTPALDPESLEDRNSAGPERSSIAAETVYRFERALARLPRDFRTVFTLRELEGMSVDETARTLGIRPATVKTRLFRARSLLRERAGLRLDELRDQVHAFAGARCDAMVEQVFRRLQAANGN